MAADPINLPVLAREKEAENREFRLYLKQRCGLDPAQVDAEVFAITKRVWAAIDCTACANCCKQTRPTLGEEDLERLDRRLRLERRKFIDAYLKPTEEDEDNPWQMAATPCPFLKDNRCHAYEDRPANCRGYPYLYEPDFVFRTIAMLGRTSTCPIVYEVLEELKRSLDFPRPRGKKGR